MRERSFHIVAAVLAGLAVSVPPRCAHADGAAAVGMGPGGAVDGFTFGVSSNASDDESAKTQALALCHRTPDVPEDLKASCKVVQVYRNSCLFVAMDPEKDTPGFGWSLGATSEEAERKALDECRKVDGDRRDQCRIADRNCDGSAK